MQDGNGAGFPRDFWGKGQLRDGARAWGCCWQNLGAVRSPGPAPWLRTERPPLHLAACAEAYSNAQERFGCRTGCRKQLPEVESRMDKVRGRWGAPSPPLRTQPVPGGPMVLLN